METDDLNLTDLPGELYYDADEGIPSNTVHVECPVCHEELEVKLTIINDSDGDGIYTRHFTTIDSYDINYAGHEECKPKLMIYDGKYESTNTELEATILEAGFKLIEEL